MTQTPIEDAVLHSSPAKARLIVGIEGEEKTGKDHFAFTAPGPIYLQTCDPEGTDGVKQKFPGKIWTPRDEGYQLKVQPGQCSASEMKKVADPLLDKWVANYRAALPRFRTIVWDTADELYELIRLAKFGELKPKLNQGERSNEYGEIYALFEALVKEAFNYPVNLIMINRLKDEYVGSNKSGRRVRAGYKDAGYLTNVNLRSDKTPKVGGVGVDFWVKVLDCRRNPDIEGMVMQNNFAQLAMIVLPGVDPDIWM